MVDRSVVRADRGRLRPGNHRQLGAMNNQNATRPSVVLRLSQPEVPPARVSTSMVGRG